MRLHSNWNRSFLLFLLDWHLGSSGPIFGLEVILPVLAVLAQILFKRQFRFHPFECVSQMIYIFVGPPRTKTTLYQFEVFVIKPLAILRIIDFEYLQCLHHLPRLDFIGTLCEYRWNHNLKVRTYGHQSSMVIVHVSVCEMLERVFVSFIYQKEILFIDIIIVFEGAFDDLHVVEYGL